MIPNFTYRQYVVFKNNCYDGVYKIMPYCHGDMAFDICYKVTLVNTLFGWESDHDFYTTDLNSLINEDNLFNDFISANIYYNSLCESLARNLQ